MIDYAKNMLIGLFVAIACGLLVGMILFLEPSVGDGKETLIIRFSNINGITVGTRVMFAGKPVGEVVAIKTIPHAREQPTDELGQVYFYELVVHVDSKIKAYNTDEFTVQTSGLLGEKSIAIIPKAPPKGVTPKLVTEKTPIYAESVDPIESAFNELGELSDKFEEALDKVITWIDQNGHEMGSAIRSFDDAIAEAATTLKQVNQTDLVGDIKKATQNFSIAMEDVYMSIDEMRQDQVFKNIGVTLVNMRDASGSIKKITGSVEDGKGTISKLFKDEDTYLRVTAILSKIDTLMNDVNHYGVFFNLNKEWQRTRLKQVTFLNALSTPESFRNYFEKEVDLINTSMSRISMLVDRAEVSPEREEILDSKLFKRDFAELLRLTKELSDNLELYNEQLMQAQGN